MIVKAFAIKCLTNMHVGNGDVNFNIIDNEVERDPVTNYPTINSSGVKGALREFFEAEAKDKVNDIFGTGSEKNEGIKSGKIRFLSANMLALPMRASGGSEAFYMVTTDKAIELFNSIAGGLTNGKAKKVSCTPTDKKAWIDGKEHKLMSGLEDFGIADVVVMKEGEFSADNNQVTLPVTARNCLENGKSVNLWYEEVVPHESVFTMFMIANDTDRELLEFVADKVTSSPVQFGGNATIGYGVCSMSLLGGQCNE